MSWELTVFRVQSVFMYGSRKAIKLSKIYMFAWYVDTSLGWKLMRLIIGSGALSCDWDVYACWHHFLRWFEPERRLHGEGFAEVGSIYVVSTDMYGPLLRTCTGFLHSITCDRHQNSHKACPTAWKIWPDNVCFTFALNLQDTCIYGLWGF